MKSHRSREVVTQPLPAPESTLPATLVEHLPEHLAGEQLEASNKLYALRRNCEDIIALEGQKTPSQNYSQLSVGATAIEVDTGKGSLFARMYKGETADKETAYGFILSGTPEPASSYDGYSLLRIELALNGTYELVTGGADKSPHFNDIAVIDLLSSATKTHKNALVEKHAAEQREAGHKRADRMFAARLLGTGVVALAALGFGAKKVYDVVTPDHAIPQTELTYIRNDQSMTPAQVGDWTKKEGQQDFQRIIFDTHNLSPMNTPSQCKSLPINDPDNTEITSVVDYRENRSGSWDKDLSNQFEVTLEGKTAKACWYPSIDNFNTYNTNHPIVGIKTVHTK